MARKAVHTKRGTYYNGVTGRRKVSNPLGANLKVATASYPPKGTSLQILGAPHI